jgi:hypothetical protein
MALHCAGAGAGRTYRLGSLFRAPRSDPNLIAFFEGMRQYGFVEGQNLLDDPNGYELRLPFSRKASKRLATVLTPVTRQAATASPAPLSALWAKRLAIEEAPHKLSRTARYHDRIGLGTHLQASGKLDGFAQQPMLIHALADQVAADDRSASNADA